MVFSYLENGQNLQNILDELVREENHQEPNAGAVGGNRNNEYDAETSEDSLAGSHSDFPIDDEDDSDISSDSMDVDF